jgi:uncharacterized protein (DUF488 family)
MSERIVYTVGHSTHAIEPFIGLLSRHGITAVADVRSSPYSRRNPQFNRENLERSLKNAGIGYVFLGRELGARSEDASCYEDGRVQFSRLASMELFRAGLERVCTAMESHRVALMCAEKEPLDCHRTILVSRALEAEGISIVHMLADGGTETHAAAMQRLLAVTGLSDADLFRSKTELIDEAYARQGARIAYVKPLAD